MIGGTSRKRRKNSRGNKSVNTTERKKLNRERGKETNETDIWRKICHRRRMGTKSGCKEKYDHHSIEARMDNRKNSNNRKGYFSLLKIINAPIFACECNLCAHTWRSLARNPPTECPRCGSREWNGKKIKRQPQAKPKADLPKPTRVREAQNETSTD
jgi:rubrerythrin